MCIAKRLSFALVCALAFAALQARSAGAHPVAQGALEIVVFPERLSVTAKVSMEEVLVAAAYGARKGISPIEMMHIHGDYLLAHFRVAADGRPLEGRVVKTPEQAGGRPYYILEY
jgi:hypothetical protein